MEKDGLVRPPLLFGSVGWERSDSQEHKDSACSCWTATCDAWSVTLFDDMSRFTIWFYDRCAPIRFPSHLFPEDTSNETPEDRHRRFCESVKQSEQLLLRAAAGLLAIPGLRAALTS